MAVGQLDDKGRTRPVGIHPRIWPELAHGNVPNRDVFDWSRIIPVALELDGPRACGLEMQSRSQQKSSEENWYSDIIEQHKTYRFQITNGAVFE
mmetsp:Transcript_9859/g.24574  ORF Transcript_9859/g.24574 Transcript_9859/m.24574 type:complete len:94 (+) Transcript_9859:1121-1402(+)